MLSYLFRKEMGEKPYLHIEVDEHFSPVGVITRIEAFLQSLENRPSQPLPERFQFTAVEHCSTKVVDTPESNRGPLYVLNLPPFTTYLRKYAEMVWNVETRPMPLGGTSLVLGRAETSSKEYLPFPALLGGILDAAEKESDSFQMLIPSTQGAEADGQYPWAVEAVLANRGLGRVTLVSPELETLPENVPDPDLLFRAVLAGDLILCAPPEQRKALSPEDIPNWDSLGTLAAQIGSMPVKSLPLAAVGEPLTLFALDDKVLETLERQGRFLCRAPLSEYLWFLWRDAGSAIAASWTDKMTELGHLLGARSSFSKDPEGMRTTVDHLLPGFSGANGRYRLAKARELGQTSAGVLTLAPRYENTATVLDMTGELDGIPHLHLAMDSDWDESVWSRLKSFLYYLK